MVLAETDAHLGGGSGAARAARYGENAGARDPFIARAVAAAGALQDPEPPARPRRVSVPVQAGVRWATLIGALDEKNLSQRLVDRRARLVTSALAVSSLGLVILLMLLNLEVLNPIRSIVRMAAGLAAGDLKARASVRGATELQILATTLNSAARKLGQTQEELESEVARRTDELQTKNAELSQLNAQLERLALSDPLTGLFNRRYLDQALALETTRQRRGKRPFSLVMVDVDHFKHYNDSHGHPKGDVLLRELAALLTQNVRASDIVCRVGGEEFVVVLIDAELPTAFAAAEKLRAAVAAHPFAHAGDQPLGKLTVSAGVASWPKHGIEPDDVLEAADRALYKSKGAGRDRVTAAAAPGDVT